jgi:hypothetical protein
MSNKIEALDLEPLGTTKSVYLNQELHEAIYYVYAYYMLDMKSLCCQLCWFHLWIMAQCDQYAMLLFLCLAYSRASSNGPSASSIAPESEQRYSDRQNLSAEHVALEINLSCVMPRDIAGIAGAKTCSILGSQKSYYYSQRLI